MTTTDQQRLAIVRRYHDQTKHHPRRYARSLGFMDWANQPNPFRTFAGAEPVALDHPTLLPSPTYDDLFAGTPPTWPIGRDSVSRLFYDSLALSAWKQAPGTKPWSLRINPSSGALHPTEAYLIADAVPGLSSAPTVFHYAPYPHALERRLVLSPEQLAAITGHLPAPCLLVALTSICWRETWKYGERGFRYVHHDAGHAIGTVTIAARTLGWEAALVEITDGDLSLLLGTAQQHGIEAEQPDCLLALFPVGQGPVKAPLQVRLPLALQDRLAVTRFAGRPNALSKDHHSWPVIDEVAAATRLDVLLDRSAWSSPEVRTSLLPDRGKPAQQIIRQRRSALDMDGQTPLSRETFYHTLSRTMPRPDHFPFSVLPWSPRVSLALFVHRVEDLDRGLYLLVRHPFHESSLRVSLDPTFAWRRPPGCPADLPLFLLRAGDARRLSKHISCEQDIAADGAFSLGMLAVFDASLSELGSSWYPRLFWETGLIGQVLYLEAEAAGVRATGIGCFFDDLMHDLVGLKGHAWQSLYHFTVGGPVDDPRLQTIAPYAHLHPACSI